MKRIFMAVSILFSGAVWAEASFDQVERLIEHQNYTVAELALEEIIKNHPESARAYYAMAQAQAGKGNLIKAEYALNKAQALDPTLAFASSSNVDRLRQAITPQTQKIEVVDTSHWFLWTLFILAIIGFGYWVYLQYKKAQEEDEGDNFGYSHMSRPRSSPPSSGGAQATSTYKSPEYQYSSLTGQGGYAKPSHPYVPPAQPTIINNNTHSGSNDFLTGVIVGDMLGHNHSDHTYVEREIIRDSGDRLYDRDRSWDDDDTLASIRDSAKSSSWDSDSSSSRSSSWDSSSWGGSSSDSSWDSSSSSSSSSD